MWNKHTNFAFLEQNQVGYDIINILLDQCLLFWWGVCFHIPTWDGNISHTVLFSLAYQAAFFPYCLDKFCVLKLFLHLVWYSSPVKPSGSGVCSVGLWKGKGREYIISGSFQELFFPLSHGPGKENVWKTMINYMKIMCFARYILYSTAKQITWGIEIIGHFRKLSRKVFTWLGITLNITVLEFLAI